MLSHFWMLKRRDQQTKEEKLFRASSIKEIYDAKIVVGLSDGSSYTIHIVVLNNNHDVSPSKTRPGNNITVNMSVKRTLELNDEACVRKNKSYQTFMVGVKV